MVLGDKYFCVTEQCGYLLEYTSMMLSWWLVLSIYKLVTWTVAQKVCLLSLPV